MDSTRLDVARRSLRQRLLKMVNVQACIVPPQQPLLVVQTWTGVIIHVYFVLSPPKTRSIRKILQDRTEIGIGTIFLVNREILPEANLRLSIPEWLNAIHALTNERIYAVDVKDDELILGQLHFEAIGSTGDHVARYGPPPKLERLRFLRTTIKPRYIRGDWQLADFGPEAFWKDPYSPRHANGHYHRPDPREYQWKSWSGTSWDQPHTQEIPSPRQPLNGDTVSSAYALLEVERDATRDEVRAAFRELAIRYHPDTSTLPTPEAEAKFRALNEAYEVIRVANKW